MLTDEHNNLWLFPAGGQAVRPTEVIKYKVPWAEAHAEPFAVIDFESYYSKKYSLSELSAWEYVNNPAFDPYCVSVMVCHSGFAYFWVGPPNLIPWDAIARIKQWVSHNAGYDELAYHRCVALGLIPPGLLPEQWDCTSDMARYLQRMGSLELSCLDLLQIRIQKGVVAKLKGGGGSVSLETLLEYNTDDCWYSGLLWCRVALSRWPERERALSRQTRHIGWRGFWCDADQLRGDIQKLGSIMAEIALQIPWVGGGRAITSLKEVAAQCDKEGIPAPPSLTQEDPGTMKWAEKYGNGRPWLGLLFRYSKCRQTQSFFELLLERRRKDGTVPFDLLYCKAPHTHRWQSGKKVRMQNLDRGAVEGIHVRHRLRPRPGEKFIIRDCSQIEPRVLNWLAGDWEFLEFCKKYSPYEAHARAHMGYHQEIEMKKGDPDQYQLAKAEVLALGYQAGPPKFIEMARDMCKMHLHEFERTASIRIGKDQIWFTEAQLEAAEKGHGDRNLMDALASGTAGLYPPGVDVVKSFRRTNKKVVNFWGQNEADMRACVGGDYLVTMPDGLILHYFDVKDTHHGLSASVIKNSPDPHQTKYFYGGKLTENKVQLMARSILGEILLRLERIPVGRLNWHSHDEAIIRVPAQHAEEMLEWTEHAFNAPIPWAPGLPLASEGNITDYYNK